MLKKTLLSLLLISPIISKAENNIQASATQINDNNPTNSQTALQQKAENEIKDLSNPRESNGLDTIKNDFGLGVGIGVEQYRSSYIENASINGTDKIVSIDKQYKTIPSVWLTANWNLWGDIDKSNNRNSTDIQKVKYGLFVGAKIFDINADTGLKGFALGPQVNFSGKDREFSLGIGWVNHQVKKLGKGISEGNSLPDYYSEIKYRERSENSVILMFSTNLLSSKSSY